MKPPPTVVISLAARPGVFGQTVHNAGYAALGINFSYRAMACEDLAKALQNVRNLGIRGASLTMPFKVQAVPMMDELSPLARAVGAVNTVVNDGGKLSGHNTDVVGAVALLDGYQYLPWRVLGAGGMARAFLQAARILSVPDVSLSARNATNGEKLAASFGATFVPWAARAEPAGMALLNATSIGMAPDVGGMATDMAAARPAMVFDAVPNPVETAWVRAARGAGVPVITGRDLQLAQAFAQFELYTGHAAPRDAMASAANQMQEARQ